MTAGRAWQPRRPKSAETYLILLRYFTFHTTSLLLREHVSGMCLYMNQLSKSRDIKHHIMNNSSDLPT